MFSQTEFLEWKNNPVTQFLFKELKQDLNDIADAWQAGDFLGNEEKNAKNVGIAYGIRCVLEWSPVAESEGVEQCE